MNVQITKFNARRILKELELSLEETEQEIYKINFRWFNKLETQTLLTFKLLYENPDDFFKKYQKTLKIDTETYAFNNRAPSYHRINSCDRLNSNFKNIKIPVEIINRGDEAVSSFRAWCRKNRILLEDLNQFALAIKDHFQLASVPEFVDFTNSGTATFENVDLETLEPLINELISEAEEYYKSSDAIRTILNRFGKSSYLHNKSSFETGSLQLTSTQTAEVLRTFEQKFKQPLIYYLQEYYRLKYNPELTFNGLLLEEIGFKPCYRCFDPEFIADFEKRVEVRVKVASGKEACGRGDCDQAQLIYTSVLLIDPNNQEALLNKIICTKRNDYSAIISEGYSHLLAFGQSDKLMYALSRAYLNIKAYTKAIEYGLKVSSPEGKFFFINYIIGVSYFKIQEFGPAYKFLDRYAKERKIKDGQICYFLAGQYYKEKKYDLALPYYETALSEYRRQVLVTMDRMKQNIESCKRNMLPF